MPQKPSDYLYNMAPSSVNVGAVAASRNQLGQLLQRSAYDVMNQTLTDTQFYQQGQAQLQENLGLQEQQDAAGAAARGLTGSAFEIAQLGQRGRMAGSITRDLLTGAEQSLAARQSQAASNLLNFQGLQESALGSDRQFALGRAGFQLEEARRRDQRRAANQQFIGGLFRSITNLFNLSNTASGGS